MSAKPSPATSEQRALPVGGSGNDPTKTATESHADPVVQVFKWVLAGNAESDIVEALAATYPKADGTKVMAAVMTQFRESAEIETDVVMGWCIESTRDLYRRMVEIGDFASALRAIKQMAELTKYVPNRIRRGEVEE